MSSQINLQQENDIVLTYFQDIGRAESSRIAFYMAGIDFVDNRISRQEFEKQKQAGEFKFQQLPVLYIGGKQFAQSGAILRYAAKKADLYPQEDLQQLIVEQALGSFQEISNRLAATLSIKDDDEKQAVQYTLAQGVLPKWLGHLNQLLKENNTGFYVGKQLTIADIDAYALLKWIKSGVFKHIPVSIVNKYQSVEANFQMVQNLQKVQEWNQIIEKQEQYQRQQQIKSNKQSPLTKNI